MDIYHRALSLSLYIYMIHGPLGRGQAQRVHEGSALRFRPAPRPRRAPR